jgi:hypothetical protein
MARASRSCAWPRSRRRYTPAREEPVRPASWGSECPVAWSNTTLAEAFDSAPRRVASVSALHTSGPASAAPSADGAWWWRDGGAVSPVRSSTASCRWCATRGGSRQRGRVQSSGAATQRCCRWSRFTASQANCSPAQPITSHPAAYMPSSCQRYRAARRTGPGKRSYNSARAASTSPVTARAASAWQ